MWQDIDHIKNNYVLNETYPQAKKLGFLREGTDAT